MRLAPLMLAVILMTAGGHESVLRAQEVVPVEQGWTNAQKADWYQLSQGSRLIPYDWLVALEQPGSSERFLDRVHIEKFRYLFDAPVGAGLGLPVGFVIDEQDDSNLLRTKLRWKDPQ